MPADDDTAGVAHRLPFSAPSAQVNLRFIERFEEMPTIPTSVHSDGIGRIGRKASILQQLWVTTVYDEENGKITAKETVSEWRDVPLVVVPDEGGK